MPAPHTRLYVRALLWVAALAVVLLSAAALVRRESQISTAPQGIPGGTAQGNTLDLQEIGVRLTLPSNLTDIAYEPLTIPGTGTLISLQATSIPSPGHKGCPLATALLVPKSTLAAAGLTREILRARESETFGTPPQVKEFPDAYFVFQPSTASCSSDPAVQARQSAKQRQLWSAVPGVSRINASAV